MGMYYMFADAFGFTPDVVDSLDVVTLQSLSIIHQAKLKREEEEIRRARR